MSSIEDMRRSILTETVALNRANELRIAMAELQRLAHIVSFATGIEDALRDGADAARLEAVTHLRYGMEAVSVMLDGYSALIGLWSASAPEDDHAA